MTPRTAHNIARMARLALILLLGVAIAPGIVAQALNSQVPAPGPGTPTLTTSSAFANEVDLSMLGRTAVHTAGRFKSLDSFAAAVMHEVVGSNRIDGRSHTFTYLDMMFRPAAYASRPAIYIHKKPIRQRLAEALAESQGDPLPIGLAAELEHFIDTGLISEEMLRHPAIEAEMNRMRADLIRTAKFVEDIDLARAIANWQNLLGGLRIVPPPGGGQSDPWLTLSEFASRTPGEFPGLDASLHTQILAAWETFARGWIDQDPARVNQGADALAELLPQVNPTVYPDEARSGWPWTYTAETAPGWIASAALLLASIGLFGFAMRRTKRMPRTAGVALTIAVLIALLHAGAYFVGRYDPLALESFYFRNYHWFTLSWVIYLFSVVFLLMAVVYRWSAARIIGMTLFSGAFAIHTAALLMRWYVADRWPNSNMFEAVTTAAWMAAACAILLEIIARRTLMRNLFALAAAAGSMTALMAAHFLPQALNAHISNRMPVLHDVWLYIHTNVIIFSYGLIFLAAVVATLYLGYRLTLLIRGVDGQNEFARVGGAGTLMERAAIHPGVRERSDELADDPPRLLTRAARSGSTSMGQVFDGATMILMELSFVLLWAGIVMGAMWADHSWGRPWGWDPKEVFALNTFIVFAVLVHVRLKVRDKGLWTSLLVIAGCVVMLFNWIFINFKIAGLHSYA